jgi:hypothetical protein
MKSFYNEKRVMPARKSSVAELPRTVRPRAKAASAKPVTRTPRHKKAAATVEPETSLAVNEVEAQTLSLESIAKLAYSYWEARGYEAGDPREDWFRAERELGLMQSLN